MSNKKSSKLGDVGRVLMCKRVLKHQTTQFGEIPFYKIATFGGRADSFIAKDLYDEYRKKYSYPKKGDILISAAGTVGETVIYDGKPAYFQDSNIVWIDNDETKILNRYLYYFYQTKPWLTTNGSTIKRIYNENLRSIEITYQESLQEQLKIAAVLSALDAKIEVNNRINAELEAMAKTLYDYWFVQFDFPDENGKPYKSSGGKMTFNPELKRQIPDGWTAEKMSDWIKEDKSGDWGKEFAEGNYTQKVTCIRGADIDGLNGLEDCSPPERFILQKNSRKILKSHDLIIEISGGSPTQSTGRLAYITASTLKRFEDPIICSNFCKAISLKDKNLFFNFIYYWNSLYDHGAFFGHEGKTSGIKNLLFDSFVNSFYTVVPEHSVVRRFYVIMNTIHEKKQIALAENQHLSTLRDWLLPMLMNGQVTVK